MSAVIQGLFTPCPISISLNATLARAYLLMKKEHIRHLPVLADGQLVGIISDRDVGRALHLKSDDAAEPRPLQEGPPPLVRNFMSYPVQTLDSEASLLEATELLIDKKIGALIITGKSRGMVGILTREDLLSALARVLHDPDEKTRGHLQSLALDCNVGAFVAALSNSGI